MDFNHSEERQMLADTLARYLMQRYGIEDRHDISASDRGWSKEHWEALAELGVVGALFGEAEGGFGGGGFDIAVVFEQIGRGLVVEPFLGALMGGRLLSRAGASVDLVERLIGGDMTIAFAHQEPLGRYDLEDVGTVARAQGDIWELTGDKAVVPQLGSADAILVTARIEGASETQAIGLFLVEPGTPGVDIRDYPLIDGGRAGELGLHAAAARLLARDALPLVEDAVAAGLVALCWEAVGVMSVLREATLDYLRTRQQFGAPIGKFQALQHRMATVALEIEQARSAAINAAAALDGPRDARERSASAAKYTIGRVGTLVAEEAIQMHGGIGMTWELPVSHYAKRLTLIGHQLGDEDHHLERFITLGRAA